MDELPFGGLIEEYLPCDWRYIAALEAEIARVAETIAAKLREAHAVDVTAELLHQLLSDSELFNLLTAHLK